MVKKGINASIKKTHLKYGSIDIPSEVNLKNKPNKNKKINEGGKKKEGFLI